jgi:peptide/nickel transport system permease protein
MNRYILQRIWQSLPVLLGITILTFAFTELAPGDAVTAMVVGGQRQEMLRNQDAATLRRLYNLDQPAPVRYLRWLRELLRGNMGQRLITRTSVADDLWRHTIPTVQLMGAALLLSILLGIPLGVASALHQYSLYDYSSTLLLFAAVSVPGFFAAIGAIYLFAVVLGWFPTSGYATAGATFDSHLALVADRVRHLALPALVLGLSSTAGIMRYMRTSMIEALHMDCITTARAKGLPERVVIVRHVLRNALLPVVTIIGLHLPELFGGTIIIETIFNWPGMGILYLDAVTMRDYPLIMSIVLVSALVIVLSNLLTDLAYGFIDPRIRYE